jgi:uncharacterized protein
LKTRSNSPEQQVKRRSPNSGIIMQGHIICTFKSPLKSLTNGVLNISNQSNRLIGIDGIRGLSLLGILLANTLAFQYGIWESEIISFFELSAFDEAVYSAVLILVKGSFAPIFAFLYGFGTIKMSQNLEQRGLSPYPFLIRRFLFLLAAGLLHFLLLWEGDVLATYGLSGFLLLAFLKVKPKALIIVGISVLALFSLMTYGSAGSTALPGVNWEDFARDSMNMYQNGGYSAIQSFRLELGAGPFSRLIFIINWLFIPILISSMFMFGMAAAKARLFHQPAEEKRLYVNYAAILIPAGIALKAVKVVWPQLGIGGSLHTLGGTVLALGYVFAFALLFIRQNEKPAAWRTGLISVGKLSMSNYLLQTVFGVLIFYGYGLGLFGKLGTAIGCLLAIAFFGLQAWASGLYLRRFKMGPAEKLLRSVTWLGQGRKREQPRAPGM